MSSEMSGGVTEETVRPLRIRDFVVTRDDWIFAVVCYDVDRESGAEKESKERGARCLLRYVPDERGDRISEGKRFRKLDFASAYEFLRVNRPEYLKGNVQVVPREDIVRVLRPEDALPSVASQDERVRKIVEMFSDEIPVDKMGITGSFLCGLQKAESDIDFVIYGIENFNKAREILREATEKGYIRRIDDDMWCRIYKKRKPSLPFRLFKAHEVRKWNRGAIGDTYFDVLFVRDRSEMSSLRRIYRKGRRLCVARVECVVKDAKFCFDSPAVYVVETINTKVIKRLRDDVKSLDEITEILSFTHTYAGQAFDGERVVAQGVVEECDDGSLRLVVGTTREAKGEWIICTDVTKVKRSWQL